MRKWGAALLVAAITLVLAACGSGGSGTTSAPAEGTDAGSTDASSTDTGSTGETYKLVLSNNYMGNEWRPQMENVAKFVASSEQYADRVDLEIQNSDVTPTAQIASLQNIIRQDPDAILIDSASATALNPTIEQACQAGIVVISFDQVATAPCNYKIRLDYEKTAHDMVTFLAEAMGGEGKIIMDTGLAGIPLSAAWVETWEKILSEEYPGIEIVGTYESQYAPGPELQAVSALISQHPQIDGILSGAYCTSDIKALKSAGRELVPMSCLNVNGNEIACKEEGIPCLFVGAPAWVSGVAIEKAVELLEGGTLPKLTETYDTNFVNNPTNVEFDSAMKIEPLTPGVNFYPDDSPSLITPITYGDYNMTPADVLGQ